MSELKEGDVVELKSNGPEMTIEKIDGEEATCVWVRDENIIRGTFSSIVLKKCTEGGDLDRQESVQQPS